MAASNFATKILVDAVITADMFIFKLPLMLFNKADQNLLVHQMSRHKVGPPDVVIDISLGYLLKLNFLQYVIGYYPEDGGFLVETEKCRIGEEYSDNVRVEHAGYYFMPAYADYPGIQVVKNRKCFAYNKYFPSARYHGEWLFMSTNKKVNITPV